MKRFNILTSFFIGANFLALSTKAQMDSCNVFLQGYHIEVGINSNGAYGSSIMAPAGYHPKGGADMGNECYPAACTHGGALGFVADPDKDGWTIGTPPYFGDYFLPGTPQEGWSIEADGVQANAWNGGGAGCGTTGYSFSNPGLTGKNVSYTNNIKTISSEWIGSFNGLGITQETSLDSDNVFFTVAVTITNNSSKTIKDIYYLRTVDPDNTQPETGSFTTYNFIPYQLPNPENRTLVSALGDIYKRAYLGLGTLDCRARCFFLPPFVLSPATEDLAAMYAENDTINYHYHTHSYVDTTKIIGYDPITGKPVYDIGYDYAYSDAGLGLVFSLDSLQPGESTTLIYAYILREGDINLALESTKPKWQRVGDKDGYNSKHTLSVCRNSTVPLTIDKGNSYKWTWYASNTTDFKSTIVVDSVMGSPFSTDSTVLDSAIGAITGLDTNHGVTINIDMGSVPRTYVAIGTTPACVPDTIIMHLVPDITPPPQTTPIVYYCKNDPSPKPLSAIGKSLEWYRNKTDTIGTS
ncbi:MAG: hypothetical protein ACTHJ0_04060, partial [Flavipsychrobacter sp.]